MPLNMPKKKKLLNPFIYDGLRSFYDFLFKIKVGSFSPGGEKTLKKVFYSFNFSRSVLRSI